MMSTLKAEPEYVVDLYEPTRVCADLIKTYHCKGAVIGFDKYMRPTFPGKTKAMREVFGPHVKVLCVSQVSPGRPDFLIFEG